MVVAHTTVDISALKARHPLGDTVEASGVRLRGRGRVRQGVCPFHDEVEGSFTVYGDSERGVPSPPRCPQGTPPC